MANQDRVIIRDGDIILIRARWWLHSFTEYDHAALLYSRGLAYYTIEAGFSGVRDWPWPQARPYVILHPLCDASTAYDAISIAMTWRGDPYPFGHLPGIFKRMLAMWWARRQQQRGLLAVADWHVCSELAADAYRRVGLDLCPGIEQPTPDDLYYSELTDFIGSSEDMEVKE